MKQCIKCKITKEIHDFHKNKKRKDGVAVWCKNCIKTYHAVNKEAIASLHKEYYKEYYKDNKKAMNINNKKYLLKIRYGLTLAQWTLIKNKQDNKCALCSREERLCVDHDHNTGHIRGLLCNNCNINKVSNHTLETARALVSYLEKYEI